METLLAYRRRPWPSSVTSCTVLAILTVAFSFTLFFTYSFLWIVAQCVTVASGYYLTTYLLNHSQGEFLWNFFESLLGEKLSLEDGAAAGSNAKGETPSKVRNLPWKGLYVPESVNKSLVELIEQLIDNYVNSWYKSKISDDDAFVNEVRYQIRFAIAMFYQRIQKIDLSSLVLFQAVPLAAIHWERVSRLYDSVDKKVYPPQMVETKILEGMQDVHFALGSRQNEIDYLRQLADLAVAQLVDESRIAGRATDDDSPFHQAPAAAAIANHSVICHIFYTIHRL
ncbi:unnamed protein product [Gongylonema pulchrum]|uniref:PXA domain-containing protein n=1 Tax=Gongylonema pulchrum TaxID=637853 RepID=A0A183E7B8_9BILA|nr:unnamed protein product [Gongylonema pulchrum]